MKQLILIRHAKASWGDPAQGDHERALTERGLRDAHAMAEMLSGTIEKPDLMIVSTAVRARDTAAAFIDAWKMSDDSVIYTRDIYEVSVDGLTDQISWLAKPEMQRVVVVGHNPTITEAVSRFTHALEDGMPTCGVAVITFKSATTWKSLQEGILTSLQAPKEFQ